MLNLVVHGLEGVNPVDGEASALHAAEPRHLALGKLVDGNLQALEHLVVGETAHEVLGDELLLQAVIDEVVGRDALSEQSPDLLYHALVQTGLQAAGDLLATGLTVDIDTNDK